MSAKMPGTEPSDVYKRQGFISLNVEYIDGTKIESKANKYTFVWRKTVERNRERLMKKIHVLLEQIDDVIVLVQPSAITYKL